MPKEFQVKITRCLKPNYWYSNKIGEMFWVSELASDITDYKCSRAVGKWIGKIDCEILAPVNKKKGDKFDDSLEDLEYRIHVQGTQTERLQSAKQNLTNEPKQMEEKMNNTIQKVFGSDNNYDLVTALDNEFGHEFSGNTFADEIFLTDNKDRYLKELKDREEVRKAEAEKE